MKTITARNVNEAAAHALPYLISNGVKEQSRNGAVIVAGVPVITEYTYPTERVMFSPTRDANPFFHLMEALWMLAGRNDLAFPLFFNKNFASYSDDGKSVHGAYGHRWRLRFGYDQLTVIVEELRKNPTSRRCVLSMWDATADLHKAVAGGKDVPCNTHAYFDIRQGALNMTVCNRSNDVIWGAYGANAVHFSILQEYLAAAIGVPVGVYRQFSNNFHVYTDVYDTDKLSKIADESHTENYYATGTVKPFPLMSVDMYTWNVDLLAFLADPYHTFLYNDDFFNGVARPMYLAWRERKDKRGNGLAYMSDIIADDWRMACTQWTARRERKH